MYDLNIDRALNEQLLATGDFEVMSLEADEDEHSIEMHLPYLAKVKKTFFKIYFKLNRKLLRQLTNPC